MLDTRTLTTFTPRLSRWDRVTASVDLSSGAGVIVLPTLPEHLIAEVEQISVSGTALGGAVVSVYRNDATVPENFHSSGLVPATAPGVSFTSSRPWYFGLEHLEVSISGAGAVAGNRATATVWQRLYLPEYARPAEAEHVAGFEHDLEVPVPEGTESGL